MLKTRLISKKTFALRALIPEAMGGSPERGSRSFFHKRGSSSDGPSKLAAYAVKPPKTEQPSWRRLAEAIQNQDGVAHESIYAARLMAGKDPRDNVEKIEEEIQEEMAAALGKSGGKCDYHFYILERQGWACDNSAKLLEQAVVEGKDEPTLAGLKLALEVACNEFNSLRKTAESARRDLMIHRQAVGFTTGNHEFVHSKWPLPPQKNADNQPVSAGLSEQERNRLWLVKMTQLSRK